MNVPMAPVDQGFNIPYMGMQQQPMQQSPELQQVKDVLNQYAQTKQDQSGSGGIIQQILAARMQPEMQDVSRSINQTQQAYGAPDLFKPMSPGDAMASRYATELSPYTSMLEAQGKIGNNTMNAAGGATGVLVNRLMAADPSLSVEQALQKVQTGFRSNTMIDAQGNVVPMQGALNTMMNINNAKQTGQNISDLSYKPRIAGGEASARTAVELANAAPIEAQKKIGAGEITDVQKREIGQQGLSSTVDAMLQNYQQLAQAKGTVSTGNTIGQNIGAYAKNTAIGQGMQRMVGTQEQSIRNKINMGIPALINDIRGATGMSAKAMDSNTELKFYLQMATDPTVDVEANMNALNVIKKKYLTPLPGSAQPEIPATGATHIYNPATGMVESK